MASAAKKRKTLDLWQKEFPEFSCWKDFIVKKCGPLIVGICLDPRRDPDYYTPTFFIHNLISDSKSLTLMYGVAPTRKGATVSIKYESDIQQARDSLLKNAHPLNTQISFEVFLNHIYHCFSNDTRFGHPYLPSALSDIITTGCYVGCSDYFLSTLSEAQKKIDEASDININIIGSSHKWAKDVKLLASKANEGHASFMASKIGLPVLKDFGFRHSDCKQDYLKRI